MLYIVEANKETVVRSTYSVFIRVSKQTTKTYIMINLQEFNQRLEERIESLTKSIHNLKECNVIEKSKELHEELLNYFHSSEIEHIFDLIGDLVSAKYVIKDIIFKREYATLADRVMGHVQDVIVTIKLQELKVVMQVSDTTPQTTKELFAEVRNSNEATTLDLRAALAKAN